MSFSELMEKVRRGEATPEEQGRIAELLEQHEVIEEYLAEKLNADFAESLPQEDGGETRLLTKKVNRRMRNVTLKAAAIVLAVAAAAAGIVFGVRAYNQNKYYDPNRGYEKNTYVHSGQFYLDVRAFTLLHCPGYMADFVKSVPQGNGVHTIRIALQDRFNALDSVYDGTIVRGELEDPTYRVWPLPIGNAFGYKEGWLAYSHEGGPTIIGQDPEQRGFIVEELARIPGDSEATAFLTFREELSLEELARFSKEWGEKEAYFLYAAVRPRDDRIGVGLTTGFVPSGGGALLEQSDPVLEKYPDLQMSLPYPATEQEMAEAWEPHFTTLLQYMMDRGEFLQTLGYVQYRDFYRELLEYVQEHGISIYGVMVSGNAEMLLEMEKDENVFSFYVDNVKFSRLEKRERGYAYEMD